MPAVGSRQLRPALRRMHRCGCRPVCITPGLPARPQADGRRDELSPGLPFRSSRATRFLVRPTSATVANGLVGTCMPGSGGRDRSSRSSRAPDQQDFRADTARCRTSVPRGKFPSTSVTSIATVCSCRHRVRRRLERADDETSDRAEPRELSAHNLERYVAFCVRPPRSSSSRTGEVEHRDGVAGPPRTSDKSDACPQASPAAPGAARPRRASPGKPNNVPSW